MLKTTVATTLQPTETDMENTLDPELMSKFISHDIFSTHGYGTYYEQLNPNRDAINLLNNSEAKISIENLLKEVNTNGTISPNGKIINTPSKINVKLKKTTNVLVNFTK